MSYLLLFAEETESDDERTNRADEVVRAIRSRNVDVIVKLTTGDDYRSTLDAAEYDGDGQ